MARLNEPPVSADSLEILRRKFLRQNRDIARVNSSQSLRIRSLENECARLLSENLDLRGQVLRLEKEVEDNSASRIADHALEIKARMELQLLEMGSLLESLGLEPPTKRRSPNRERKIAKPRTSLLRSPPPRRQRALSAEDQDALAMQEGRLPPIHENKSYPRQTLSCDEILALCSEAETSTDSPDLGPPPVSRFVEEEPVKTDSPSRPVRIRVYSENPITAESGSPLALSADPPAQSPVPSPIKQSASPLQPRAESPRQQITIEKPLVLEKPVPVQKPAPAAERGPVKPGSKRKFAVTDENEIPSFAKTAGASENSKPASEKPVGLRELKGRRNAKGMPSAARRASRDQTLSLPPASRPALAAKSTNEDLLSPKKPATGKVGSPEESAATKQSVLRESKRGHPPKPNQPKIVLDIAEPGPLPVAEIHPAERTATPSHSAQLLSPVTPGRPPVREESCDTPPPKDISSGGDTARPSRRARAAISYAEPNLRDKMRRPTKELTDAVSGEGKYKHRTSINHKEEAPGSVPSSATKGGTTPIPTDAAAADAMASITVKAPSGTEVPSEPGNTDAVPSPSACKGGLSTDMPPSTNITSRRKRASSNGERDGPCARSDSRPVATPKTVGDDASGSAEEAGSGTAMSALDPYEFTTTSPVIEKTTVVVERSSAPLRSSHSRSSRRPVVREDVAAALKGEVSAAAAVGQKASSRSAGSRKRASLAAPRKQSMLDRRDESDEEYGDSESTESIPATDRISRRRSMMI